MFVFKSKPDEVKTAVRTALDIGYRHIDTASGYKNEEAIGEVIAEWIKTTGKRNELFITTKVNILLELWLKKSNPVWITSLKFLYIKNRTKQNQLRLNF